MKNITTRYERVLTQGYKLTLFWTTRSTFPLLRLVFYEEHEVHVASLALLTDFTLISENIKTFFFRLDYFSTIRQKFLFVLFKKILWDAQGAN